MYFQTSTWSTALINLQNNGIWSYYRGVNLTLWLIAIVTMYIAGIIFFHRASQKDLIVSQVWLYRSFGLVFIIMSLTRISFIFGYFIEPYYNFFLSLGYTFAAISLLPIVITFERFIVTNTHKFFSIVGTALCIIAIYFNIFPSESQLSRTIQDIGMPVIALSFLILYAWVIRHSAGDVRHKAIMTLVGMVVFVVGIILDSESIIFGLSPISAIIVMDSSPIIFWLGIVIMTFSQRID